MQTPAHNEPDVFILQSWLKMDFNFWVVITDVKIMIMLILTNFSKTSRAIPILPVTSTSSLSTKVYLATS